MSRRRNREPHVRWHYDRFGKPTGYSSNEGPRRAGPKYKSKEADEADAGGTLIFLGILIICMFGFMPLYQCMPWVENPTQSPAVCWMLSAAPFGITVGVLLSFLGLYVGRWIGVLLTGVGIFGLLASSGSLLISGLRLVFGSGSLKELAFCGGILVISGAAVTLGIVVGDHNR